MHLLFFMGFCVLLLRSLWALWSSPCLHVRTPLEGLWGLRFVFVTIRARKLNLEETGQSSSLQKLHEKGALADLGYILLFIRGAVKKDYDARGL